MAYDSWDPFANNDQSIGKPSIVDRLGASGRQALAKIFEPIATAATSIMPSEKWEQAYKNITGVFQPESIKNTASAIGKSLVGAEMNTPQAALGAVVNPEFGKIVAEAKPNMTPTPEEAQAAVKTAAWPLTQIWRPVTAIQGAAGAAIKKQPVLPAAARGFILPEETSSITETVTKHNPDLLKWLSEGSPARVAPFAIADAVENIMLGNAVLGGGLKDVVKSAQTKDILSKVEKALPQIEKISKFPAGMSNQEKMAAFLERAKTDPTAGDALARIAATPINMHAGVPMPFGAGDLVQYGKNIGQIVRQDGPTAILAVGGKEVSAKLSDLVKPNPDAIAAQKNDILPLWNNTEVDLMRKAGIPDTDVANFITASKEAGQSLSDYTAKVLAGEMPHTEAIGKITRDYALTNQANQVFQQTKEVKQPLLDTVGKQIVEDVGAAGYFGTPKSVKSMIGKVIRKSNNNPDYAITSMKDHARGTIIAKTPQQISDIVKQLTARGFKLESTLDQPLNIYGYRGITASIPLGEGLNGEIQIHTPESLAIKNSTDPFYRETRSYNEDKLRKLYKTDKKEFFRIYGLAKKMRRVYKDYWTSIPEAERAAISLSARGLESTQEPTVISSSGTQALPNKTIGSESSDVRNILPSASLEKSTESTSFINQTSKENIPQKPENIKEPEPDWLKEVRADLGNTGYNPGSEFMSGIDQMRQEFMDASLSDQARMAAEAGDELQAFKDIRNSPEGDLFKAIKSLGGIKPYRKDFLKEELSAVPSWLKNKNAVNTLDTIVEELKGYGWNFENGDDLLEAIKHRSDNPLPASGGEALSWIVKTYTKNKRLQEKLANSYMKVVARRFSRPLAASRVKNVVRQATGQIKISEMIPVDQAYKEMLKTESAVYDRAFKDGELSGKDEINMRVQRKKEIAKTREEVKSLLNIIHSVDTSTMSSPSKEEIGQIQKVMDFAVPTQKTVLRLEALRDFLQNNPDTDLPDYVLKDLDRLNKLNREDVTIDELRSLSQAVQHFAHLDKLKKTILANQKYRYIEEVKTQTLVEMKPRKVLTKTEISQSPNAKEFLDISGPAAWLERIIGQGAEHYDLVIETLAGAKSTVYDILFEQVKDGHNTVLEFKQTMADIFDAELAKIDLPAKGIKNIDKWKDEVVPYGNVAVNGVRTPLELTHGERISLYLHSKNDNNLKHILEGGFVRRNLPKKKIGGVTVGEHDYRPLYYISPEDFENILNNLDPVEKAIGDINYKIETQVYEALNKVFKDKNGYALPKENNYFRIIVYKKYLPADLQQESMLEELKGKYVRLGLTKGFLKARKHSKMPIVLSDFFFEITDTVNYAAAYVGLEKPLSNASKLLYDRAWRAEFEARYGAKTWQYIEQGLRDIAGEMQAYNDLESSMVEIKNRLATAIFAIKPTAIVKQVLSYPLFNVYVPSKYLVAGLRDYLMHPQWVVERHKAYSPDYRDRYSGTGERDLADVFKSKTLGGGIKLRQKALLPMQMMDRGVTAVGMQGAVLQKLDELKSSDMTMVEKLKEAYKYADSVVNRTQSTHLPEYRSALSRDPSFVARMLTFASTDNNQKLNLIRRTWRQARRGGNKDDWDRFSKACLYGLLFSPLGAVAIGWAWQSMVKKDPKFSPFKFITDWINEAMPFYGISDFTRSITSRLQYGSWVGNNEGIVNQFFGNLGDVAENGFRAMGDIAGGDQEKAKKHAAKFAEEAVSVLADINGINVRTGFQIMHKILPDEKSSRNSSSNNWDPFTAGSTDDWDPFAAGAAKGWDPFAGK